MSHTESENDEINWPQEDLTELFHRIESSIPENDTALFSTRVKKLNWDEIAFKSYSGDKCRDTWVQVQKRLRHYRVLKELISDAKKWVKKPSSNFYKVEKTKKHPDFPKAPLSSFMIFYMKKKPKVVAENPGMNMKNISKIIGEMFRELSPEQKHKYEKEAAERRLVYNEELEKFRSEHPDYLVKSKKNFTPVGLKKPRTPLEIFINEKMQANTDYTKEELHAKWTKMKDSKKCKWIKWAQSEEEVYKNEMQKYKSQHPEYSIPSTKSVITKEDKTILERVAGKPEKPPTSAYQLFTKMMLINDEIKQIPPKNRLGVIGAQWKTLGTKEKDMYKHRLDDLQKQYDVDWEVYVKSLSDEERQIELKKVSKKRKAAINIVEPKPKKKNVKENPSNIDENSEITEAFDKEPEPPPSTPFDLFYKEQGGSVTRARNEWENFSKKERKKYKKRLSEWKDEYILQYEQFLNSLAPEQLQKFSSLKSANSKMKEEHGNEPGSSGS